ncbi:serine threonine kinase [Fusarium albosuccineum]|uniref:Serine threonine kinase n=1 Tax=Fusarium albosuccineum TaxID=1237068 RepID=A0A8H4L869_9HYPO|nr:serine threonine kinase [Fusarium albosuccineum]
MIQYEIEMEHSDADAPAELSKPVDQCINDSLKQDLFNKEKYFLPHRKLTAICRREAVYTYLRKYFDEAKASSHAAYVCGTAKEIFAILVLIDEVSIISKFVEEGINDGHLPFDGSHGKAVLWKCGSSEGDPIELFHGSTNKTRREFYNKQWWVHVPVLARDKDDRARQYDLPSGTVLPWTFVSKDEIPGGFGKVRQVKMHKDHHPFTCDSFALKTLSPEFNVSGNKKVFMQEMKAFQQMSPGTHLLELCATFTMDSKFMLLFPWAEGGSLLNLWAQPHENLCKTVGSDSPDLVKWIGGQCQGLVQGLHMIHNNPRSKDECYFGIHGDIKPANILHFSEETADNNHFGVLKIADFGLTKFHRKGSRSNYTPKTAGAADQTYRAPEHDNDRIMSNKVDVWALGCVFSEMMTWVLEGPEGIDGYRGKRVDEPRRPWDPRWHEDNFFAKSVVRKRRDDGVFPPQPSISQDTGKAEEVTLLVKVLDQLKRVLPGRKDGRTQVGSNKTTLVDQLWSQNCDLVTKFLNNAFTAAQAAQTPNGTIGSLQYYFVQDYYYLTLTVPHKAYLLNSSGPNDSAAERTSAINDTVADMVGDLEYASQFRQDLESPNHLNVSDAVIENAKLEPVLRRYVDWLGENTQLGWYLFSVSRIACIYSKFFDEWVSPNLDWDYGSKLSVQLQEVVNINNDTETFATANRLFRQALVFETEFFESAVGKSPEDL